MSRNVQSGKSSRGLLSPRAGVILILSGFLLFIVLMFTSDLASKERRTYQGGLLTLAVLSFALIPVRVRLWRLEKEEQDRGSTFFGRYLGSSRFYIDVLLTVAVLVVVFLVDYSMLPARGLRIGVASALGLAIALTAGYFGRRKSGKG